MSLSDEDLIEKVAADRKRLATGMLLDLGAESSWDGRPDPKDAQRLLDVAKAHQERANARRSLAFAKHGAVVAEDRTALLARIGHQPFQADIAVGCTCNRVFGNWMLADAHVVSVLESMDAERGTHE